MGKLVENFNKDIDEVVNLIKLNKKEEARTFFNDKIVLKYEKSIRKRESPLVYFEIFFSELDDYLNNNGANELGVVSKESVLDSFSSDYKEDLELAKNKESGAGGCA